MNDLDKSRAESIFESVAAGDTLRQIAKRMGVSAATILRWVTADDDLAKQYTRAREMAADLFENDIYDAAMSVCPETAAADRVKIDALKWIAARRAPKKYGDRVDHVSTDGSMSPSATPAELTDEQLEKIAAAAMRGDDK